VRIGTNRNLARYWVGHATFQQNLEHQMQLKKALLAVSAVVLATVGVLAVVPAASARVVCNSYGDCWHTDTRYNYNKYDRDQHAQYHSDDWYFHQNWNGDSQRHYRDHHDGRGYYKNGIWLTF
jgi:hypothetical protein